MPRIRELRHQKERSAELMVMVVRFLRKALDGEGAGQRATMRQFQIESKLRGEPKNYGAVIVVYVQFVVKCCSNIYGLNNIIV